MIERRLESLINKAPEMEVPPSFFGRTVVSWSKREKRPILLKELIQSDFPQIADSLGFERSMKSKILRVDELSDQDLKDMSGYIFEQEDGREMLAWGKETYTKEEQLEHIRKGTTLGNQLIEATKMHIKMIVGMVESGKVKLGQELPLGFEPEIIYPD